MKQLLADDETTSHIGDEMTFSGQELVMAPKQLATDNTGQQILQSNVIGRLDRFI